MKNIVLAGVLFVFASQPLYAQNESQATSGQTESLEKRIFQSRISDLKTYLSRNNISFAQASFDKLEVVMQQNIDEKKVLSESSGVNQDALNQKIAQQESLMKEIKVLSADLKKNQKLIFQKLEQFEGYF